jgi:hypothetical protein
MTKQKNCHTDEWVRWYGGFCLLFMPLFELFSKVVYAINPYRLFRKGFKEAGAVVFANDAVI